MGKRTPKKHAAKILLTAVSLTIIGIFILTTTKTTNSPGLTPRTVHAPVLKQPLKVTKPTPPAPAPAPKETVLLEDNFDGPNRLLTSEYSHWNPTEACTYKSTIWDMTSGSFYIKDGYGYSGAATIGKVNDCRPSAVTNSAVFRLASRNNSFSNVNISLDYYILGRGSAPTSSYDGLHIWTGYQSQYALYAISIFRWDQNLVIKKKVPEEVAHCSNPSNDGCYSELTSERPSKLSSASVWHHATIKYTTNPNNTVTMDLSIDNQDILQTTDSNSGGPAYTKGAVGIRGDNTEFYVNNFKVTAVR